MEEGELRCPMPVIRDEYDDDTDERRLVLDRCEESVYVSWGAVASPYRYDDQDPWDLGARPEGGQWDLRCAQGHVILTCATEDRDVEFDGSLARHVYDYLAAGSLEFEVQPVALSRSESVR